ncbi:hypothetical protein ACG2F4_16580 [Halalkalibaculum sp. DA3122]|uniref:hypothetical protein n=1 Tax=Halalkalibaculum sp. DA3122 TaxID=3373607 RepID=UPI003754B5F0
MTNSNTFTFWYRWLLAASIISAGIGLASALLPDSIIFKLYNTAMADAFSGGSFTETSDQLRRFLFGPLGGTIAGYFVLQTFIVWNGFYRRERWTWHAILWALLLWFTIDTAVSLYHRAYFNVWMINIWTLALHGIPLAMTYRYFDHAS